jgi:hypothetical protein
MFKLSTLRNSGFSRSVVAFLAIFFVAWTLLPHCECLLPGHAESTAKLKNLPADTGLVLAISNADETACHCLDHAPTFLDSYACGVVLPACPSFDFIPMTSGDEMFGSIVPIANKSRGPPIGDLLLVENCLATYIRHCSFLI